jgi:hypothetical protein
VALAGLMPISHYSCCGRSYGCRRREGGIVAIKGRGELKRLVVVVLHILAVLVVVAPYIIRSIIIAVGVQRRVRCQCYCNQVSGEWNA